MSHWYSFEEISNFVYGDEREQVVRHNSLMFEIICKGDGWHITSRVQNLKNNKNN